MLTNTVEIALIEFSIENEIDGLRRNIIRSFPIIRIMNENRRHITEKNNKCLSFFLCRKKPRKYNPVMKKAVIMIESLRKEILFSRNMLSCVPKVIGFAIPHPGVFPKLKIVPQVHCHPCEA